MDEHMCVDGQMDRLDRGLLSWRQWGRERKCIIYFLRSQKSGSHHSRVLSHDPVVALVFWPVPRITCSPPQAPGDPSSQGHFHMNSGKRERRGVRCLAGTTQSPCPPTHMGPHSLRPPKNSQGTPRLSFQVLIESAVLSVWEYFSTYTPLHIPITCV